MQELGALINYSVMHPTLYWANDDVGHTINLDCLVEHEDHSQVCDGVFVCNCSIYGTGIGMSGLLVKSVDVNEMFIVVNN